MPNEHTNNVQCIVIHFSGQCACQTPVSWEFSHLDLDTDGMLAGEELHDLDSNGYEHCVMPFIESCDYNKDKRLSERAWCCCFVNYRECEFLIL